MSSQDNPSGNSGPSKQSEFDSARGIDDASIPTAGVPRAPDVSPVGNPSLPLAQAYENPVGAGFPQPGNGQEGAVPTAEVAPASSPVFWILFGIGIFSFFCLLICSGVAGLLYYISLKMPEEMIASDLDQPVFGRADLQKISVPRPKKDFFQDASFRASLADQPFEVNEDEKTSIESLIATVMKQNPEDEAALRSFVSPAGFVRQMVRANPTPVLYRADQTSIENGWDQICYGPELFAGHQIIAIESVDANDVAVTMLAWDYVTSGKVVRWWLERPQANLKGRWQLCDWKTLNHSLSDAGRYAVLYEEPNRSIELQNYYSFTDRLYDENIEIRERAMEQFSSQRLPSKLKGDLAHSIARAWLSRGEPDRASSLLSRITEWRAGASRLDIHFRIAIAEEKWSEAVEFGERYTVAAGSNPWVLRDIAIAYAELGRLPKAQEIWLKLAEIQPLSSIVADDVTQWMPKVNDEFLQNYAELFENPDQMVTQSVRTRYGLQLLPVIDRWRSIDLKLLDCTKQYLKSRYASATYDYEKAIQLLKEVEASPDASSIPLLSQAYYGEPTKTDLKAVAEADRISLEDVVLTVRERFERSENRAAFISQWYWDEYVESGDFDDLVLLAELTKTSLPESIETKVLQVKVLEEESKWEELSQFLDTVPQPEDDSEWESEIANTRLFVDIELGKPVKDIMKYRTLPYFYTMAAARLVQRKQWEKLEELLNQYDSLSSQAKDELGYDSYMLRKKGQLLIAQGQNEAAMELYFGMFRSAKEQYVYGASVELLKGLRRNTELESKYIISEILPYDHNGEIISDVIEYYASRADVQGLQEIQLNGNATKYKDAIQMTVSYLVGDVQQLKKLVRSDLRRRGKAMTFLPYQLRIDLMLEILQTAISEEENTIVEAIAGYMESDGFEIGRLIQAIERQDWEQVAERRGVGFPSDVYWNTHLAKWRSRPAFQEFVKRFGWSSYFRGDLVQVVFDKTKSEDDLLSRLASLKSNWSRNPEHEKQLLNQQQKTNKIWTSADQPNWLLILAEVPESAQRDLQLDWNRAAKSVLFLLATQPLDNNDKADMRSFAFELGQDATAIIDSYQLLVREPTAESLDEESWWQQYESYYGDFPANLLGGESEQPQWKVLRDKYKACSQSRLKVGDSVKIELSQRGLTETVEAKAIQVGKPSDDVGLQVELEADSLLGPYRAGDILDVEWNELKLD